MRKIAILVAIALQAGCASSSGQRYGSAPCKPRKTITLAPHSQARKFRQQEERRVASEAETKVEGGTVVR